MIRALLVAWLGLVLFAAPVFAGGGDDEVLASKTIAGSIAARAEPRALRGVEPRVSRGAALPVLYGTLAGLQAYDGWSTVRAVRLGATEANPAVAGIASHAPAMWAVKAGATLVSIYAAERLWRRHRRTEAIVTMIAVNSAMAMVAAHNASVLKGLN
jgi:hypothetical protein